MKDLVELFGLADPRTHMIAVSPRAVECYVDETDLDIARGWKATTRSNWVRDLSEFESENVRWHGMMATAATRGVPVEPSKYAGLRAVSPGAAQWYEHFAEQVEAAVAAGLRQHEERLSRLEAAVAQRNATVQRGDNLLTDAIAKLTAKLGADFEDVSEEEAIELWGLVDFSDDDDEE